MGFVKGIRRKYIILARGRFLIYPLDLEYWICQTRAPGRGRSKCILLPVRNLHAVIIFWTGKRITLPKFTGGMHHFESISYRAFGDREASRSAAEGGRVGLALRPLPPLPEGGEENTHPVASVELACHSYVLDGQKGTLSKFTEGSLRNELFIHRAFGEERVGHHSNHGSDIRPSLSRGVREGLLKQYQIKIDWITLCTTRGVVVYDI
jgi:hypothetical protein